MSKWLNTDKELKEIQHILNQIKDALELDDVAVAIPENSKITNMNYPYV